MAVSSDALGNWDTPNATRIADSDRSATLPTRLVMAALATAVTLITTGFAFGVSNNVYHVPYVLGYAALPQFAHDQFYQDLPRIVSYVWPFERLFATESNIWALFFASYAVALFVYYAALLTMVARFVALRPLGMLLAALLIGLTFLDSGYSLLAGENIVGGYFTETQVATALVTLSLALAFNRQLLPAIVLLGVAFDAQLELALWGIAALIGVSIVQRREGQPVARQWIIGAPIALLIAAPAAVWFARSVASAGRFDGDYLAYLNLVEPNQWLVWTVKLNKWALFGSDMLLGFAAFAVLGPVARPARAAFVGFLCVFVIGCALPFVTTNQWLLNLRLMAADGFMQVIATAAAVAVVARDLTETRSLIRLALGVVIAASLVLSHYLLPIGALAMLARATLAAGGKGRVERNVAYVAVGLLLAVLAVGGWVRATLPLHWIEAEPQRAPGFVALIQWAQQNTDTNATFLVNGVIGGPFDKFQMWSKRAVWLDDRRGASGMWDPGYYAFWHHRIDQLWAMHSPTERLPFSCHTGVGYYADQATPGFDLAAPDIAKYVVFQQDGYFVIDAKSWCAAHGS